MDEDEVIVYCCACQNQMAGTNRYCRKLDTGEMVCKTCPICGSFV